MANVVLSNLSLSMPERRAPDVLTLAHARTATRVHKIAGWLWRGQDLLVLIQRTPFTAENAAHLKQYYDGLQLHKTWDKLVYFCILVELLEVGDIVPRSRFPRLRRFLDLYSVGFGAACLMPRTLFYNMHRTIWTWETVTAKQEVMAPQMPLLLSPEGNKAFGDLLNTVREALGLQLHQTTSGSSSSSGATALVPVLLVSSVGIGAAVWFFGVGELKQAALSCWSRFMEPRDPEAPTSEQGLELARTTALSTQA